jgi:hypothetical protein
MSDVTRRLSRWKAKYSPEIAAQTAARTYADMSERCQASMVALCTMETDAKQVLDQSGIDTMYIVFYLDDARQLFKLSHARAISGPTLAKGAQVLFDRWVARGLEASGLDRICSTPRHQLPEHLLPTPLSLQRESRGSGTPDRLCVESGLVLIRGDPKNLFGRGQAGVGFGYGIVAESLHALRQCTGLDFLR